jgi:chloride channel protein, CIC family
VVDPLGRAVASSIVHLNRVLVTAALSLLIGFSAMAYQLLSGRSFAQVLFSGQDALPELVEHAADYSLGVLVLPIVCKAFAYGLSLSAFRGGPVFPSMFIGAALGIASSGYPAWIWRRRSVWASAPCAPPCCGCR